MARKTKQDAQVTRHHILDAAVNVFGRQGVSKTSLNDIAKEAGVTRGAIYWHFENKVDLFNAMLERLFCPLLLKSEQRQQLMEQDPLGFLRASTLEFLTRLREDSNFRKVFEIFWHKCEYIGEMARLRQKYLEEGENHIDIIEQAMTLAQEKGQLNPCLTPHQATIGFMAMVDGLAFNWTKNLDMFPLETYAAPLLDTYLRGMGTARPTPAPTLGAERRKPTPV
ncbi:MAG: TetR family transcriptional regulator [Azovibrio sp.]|uniref:TetR family transcriptional regulator n=1 Tax=Azovibrio sp. TaxID=1872673 RepID=UPI003C77436A